MPSTTVQKPVTSTLQAIGNTPLVKLSKLVTPDSADVYVKLEYYNPTGSYKDRMALAMVEEAEKRGELRPGMTVVEFTGGSTGSSLAFVCAVKGYPLKIVELGESGEPESVTEVVRLEKRDIPEREFQVPEGYRRIDLHEFFRDELDKLRKGE